MQESKNIKYNLSIAAYISFMAGFIFKNFQRNIFSDHVFKRQVGLAAFSNYDVNSGIKCLLFLVLVVIPISFAGSLAVFQRICSYAEKRNKDLRILKKISIFIFFTLLAFSFEFFEKFGTDQPINFIYVYLLAVFISCYLYLLLRNETGLTEADLKWHIAISLTFVCSFRIVASYIGLEFPLCIAYMCIFCIMIKALNHFQSADRIKTASIPFFFSMFFLAVVLEGIVVFNQRGIIIDKLMLVIGGFFGLIILAAVMIYRLKIVADHNEWVNWGILLSFIAWAGLPPVQIENLTVDFFEHANMAVSFSQMLLFGKIPYIENVSAHLASDWLPNIIYYAFNGDYYGALVSPYAALLSRFGVIFLYFILKKCIHMDAALIVCLAMPFPLNVWGSIGLISVAAIAAIYRERASLGKFFLFWLLLAVSVLYRADLGIALGMGAVLSYFFVCILEKKPPEGKKMIISLLGVLGCFAFIFFTVCVAKKIQPIDRIREFLDIFGASNEIWSNGIISADMKIQFAVIYFITPVIVLSLMMILAYLIWKKKMEGQIFCKMIVYTLGFAYFFNLQRIIVRHNFTEIGFDIRLTFTASLFIALTLYLLADQCKLYVFATVLGVFFFIFGINTQSINTDSLLNAAYGNYDEGRVIFKYSLSQKIDRVAWSPETINVYEDIVNEISNLLSEEETFLDFSNQSFLYSIAHKENPVYTSQTLGLISGEFVQECFLKELADKDVPIAISAVEEGMNCGIGIDGFKHSYREYKISEYLNQNYMPVETVDGFAVWVKNSRKDLLEKIENQYCKMEIPAEISSHHLSIQKDNQGCMLSADGDDPYLENIPVDFWDVDAGVRPDDCTILIKYKSNVEGYMQLYYKNEMDECYTEEQSLMEPIHYEGIAAFTLNKNDCYIRLDIPDNSVIRIESVYFGKAGHILCFYDYGSREKLHNYDLGNIPYLWGTQDYKRAYENKILYHWNVFDDGQSISIDGANVYFADSIYIKMDITSDQMQLESNGSVAEIVLGNQADRFYEKIKYSFALSKGTCSYLIRVSADSYWISGEINKAFFLLPEGSRIESVELLEGD